MKIAVLGETRTPVLPYGPGGLQRTTHARATSLLKLGHDVTLYAMDGSLFDGRLLPISEFVKEWFEVVLDLSHEHGYSQTFPTSAVLNLLCDLECGYQPPNAIVESEFMKSKFPKARIVRAGIDTSAIPFNEHGGDYLAFMGAFNECKNGKIAEQVALATGLRLELIATKATLEGEALKWKLLGGALALLCPYKNDASPRAPLEAAACGTPTLCFDGDGTKDHVFDGVTGFVCKDADEMAKRIGEVIDLPRGPIRYWVHAMHEEMDAADRTERLLMKVANGERW